MTLWVVFGLVLVLCLIVGIPKLQMRTTHYARSRDGRSKELENELRKTVVQIIGGVLIVAGLYFTEQQILEGKRKEATDRFTAAVANLQSPKESVQIGGIYALSRIMRDSPSEASIVLEILSAYVGENSPSTENTQIPAELKQKIQAAVKVIGQRPKEIDDSQMQTNPIDLSHTDLRQGHFQAYRLTGARIVGSHLDGANLDGADLKLAALQGSVFDGASLRNANLEGANLTATSLRETHLEGANLSGIIGLTAEEIRRVAIVDSSTRF